MKHASCPAGEPGPGRPRRCCRAVAARAVIGVAAPAPFERVCSSGGAGGARDGFEVRFRRICLTPGYLAGWTNTVRRLQPAVADPQIDAIMCARGGTARAHPAAPGLCPAAEHPGGHRLQRCHGASVVPTPVAV
jgi:hypothetical protein